jgi:dTDP-4-amino-4,6-dideoxygalactose transaminase
MINVTKPFLPPKEEYEKYLKGIWQRGWLTNNGPLVDELETKLKDYLKTPNILYLSNGTIALQIAIKALNLTGEIITTPFSYVATTSSILWENCTPVYVDIDINTLNIDPLKIEAAITEHTSAILATHVYGNPCDVEVIEAIANKHNLKVIYDAAHAFGTTYKGKSLYEYGDVSTASFHATKLFHTIEGGAVFAKNEHVFKKLGYLRNFGHVGPESFAEVGINGKNSEFHAAMGLVNLKYVNEIMESRAMQAAHYDKNLSACPVKRPVILKDATVNFSYYPVILESEEILLRVIKELNAHWIYPRRYFYPSLTTLHYHKNKTEAPISDDISKRIICLPMFHDLSVEEMDLIVSIIKKQLL